MAALVNRIAIAIALAGCGDLHGLQPEQLPPLGSIHVRVTGDLDAVRAPDPRPPRLRVTVVWGGLTLPDASCLPPIENPDHAAVVAKGCGDPLGFQRSFETDVDAAVNAEGTATLDLSSLPSLLFGDMFSQIVYGSVVVYDDLDGSGRLDLFSRDDVPYGASFVSMAKPDTRVAFRHGAFDDRSAYYPRRGCAPPVEGYSLVSAGGFTLDQAIDAQARGELPAQDPAQCRQDPIDHELAVELRPPDEVGALGCVQFAIFFSEPPPVFPPLSDTETATACTSIPDRGTGRAHGRFQMLIAQRFIGKCSSVQHYVLRGCQEDPLCEVPEWNVAPPSWWPCPPEDGP